MLAKLLFGMLFFILTSCEPINRWIGQDDDWIGEECAEALIYYETGVDVDLTPSSPEH